MASKEIGVDYPEPCDSKRKESREAKQKMIQ